MNSPDLDQVIGDLRQRMAGLGEFQEALAAVEGVGEGADGLVSARVGAAGTVQDLHIESRAMRLDSFTLREALLAAIQQATADAQAQVAELSHQFTGTAGLADPAGIRQQMEQVAADLKRDMGEAQFGFESLLRRIRSAG